MSTSPWSFFSSLEDNSGLGREDYLTACLASLMDGLPPLMDAFLEWIQPHVSADLRARRWQIRAQRPFPTDRYGAAVLDMVFEASDLELWFEHKVDAPEGRRSAKDDPSDVIGQLAKYDVARKQRETDARHPVLLFHITARPRVLARDTLGTIHDGGAGGGYVWTGEPGHLLWADFHERARDAVLALRVASPSALPVQLAVAFLDWWNLQPNLRWVPTPGTLYPDEPSELAGLWRAAEAWLTAGVFPGQRANLYGGSGIFFFLADPELSYFGVAPVKPATIAGWSADVCDSVLQVSVTVSARDLSPLHGTWRHREGRWPILLSCEKAKKGQTLRLNVGLVDWAERHDDEGRRHAILAAVQAAVRVLREAGIELAGEE